MEISTPLKICLLSYRSNPHCGGQGVYIRNLSKALIDLGHAVEVVAGPPDPILDKDVTLSMLDCLNLYDPTHNSGVSLFEKLKNPINLIEWLSAATQGYPEPFTFGLRAYQYLNHRLKNYDIIHDNQSLSYGILALSHRIPTVATIHHPMTVDRRIAMKSVRSFSKKIQYMRWFSFITMQKRVARRLPKIITVSDFSKKDIAREYTIPESRFSVVHNGISTSTFHPVPEIKREPDRIIVTNSSDSPLKGLYYLVQAIHIISKQKHVRLTVIGTPKKNGGIVKLIETLGIGHLIDFTGRISNDEFLRQYARSSIAIIPSVYEGFGLPVGEAMACGIPVISTSGGALPEIAGDAALMVPPENPVALAKAILNLLNDPERAERLGLAGYKRVMEKFTWKAAAEKTVDAYLDTIHRYDAQKTIERKTRPVIFPTMQEA
ncbi:MAG: glycosyltransferase family 4 protein [Proteobacteria bacterium]|nr:glycosyltransferase family 4 protein [Pseudomonadota bacterium]